MNYKPLYFCDPAKAKTCKKTGCFINGGECYCTTNEDYALKEAGLYILQADTFLTDEEITILQDNINEQLRNAKKGTAIILPYFIKLVGAVGIDPEKRGEVIFKKDLSYPLEKIKEE